MATIIPSENHYYAMNYTSVDFIEGVPATYFLFSLREQGERHFNNFDTADAELHVEGLSTPFWVHKDYLILQSPFFREIFREASQSSDDSLIVINIPSPETFAPLLEYLYTGNDEKWYDTMDRNNYYDVWLNVDFLGLGKEARAICFAYYQNEILESEET
ncbi:hypothetical protein C1646_701958 [Rhizophagus diaphanus]|nr:hypothetical protein C1646_701958 [Rhizophagus diaphanus] [Rhizophagus sp. MUCL 43196]